MHKKPKILTVVGGWGFSASRLLLFGGSSQLLTPDTNKILTKVLVLTRPGHSKVGFLLTYWAVLCPSVRFLLLELIQEAGGRWEIALRIKQHDFQKILNIPSFTLTGRIAAAAFLDVVCDSLGDVVSSASPFFFLEMLFVIMVKFSLEELFLFILRYLALEILNGGTVRGSSVFLLTPGVT